MGFKKTLVHRLFNFSKFSNPMSSRNSMKPSLMRCSITPDPAKHTMAPDPGDADAVLLRRFMQLRSLYQSAMTSPGMRSFPSGKELMEKLREMNIVRDRLRLGELSPPPTPAPQTQEESEKSSAEEELTVGDAKKLLRASQMEMVKAKLREIPKDWISYWEFVEICKESCWNSKEEGFDYAKMLEDASAVIVLGNAVCLRPEQVVKAIRDVMPRSLWNLNDPRRKELEEMEKQKTEIDQKAESLVRRELWCGLGYLVVQTAAFMRLTFWELSWDVMEPICFYVTSMYFMAGYSFFLRTSKEPSFEGFFQSRFASKQKRLFKTRNFDIHRYNELRRACYPQYTEKASSSERINFKHEDFTPTLN
ncbi:hypothetical protein Ancab_026110 [Ancistrocladus abbreviatus]